MEVVAPFPLREVDRLVELTSIGAGHAASALAALVGETRWMTVPAASSEGGLEGLEDPASGIFFGIEGALCGEVAVLLPGDARGGILGTLLGPRAVTADAVERSSALQELGNILVSHLASAMADTVGGTILPSAPTLALQNGRASLDRRLRERESQGPCLRLETRIVDAEGRTQAALVFLPRPGGAPPNA